MSVKVMTWVWEYSKATLAARLVLLAIADNAGDDGAKAYPSVATIARKARVGERTVQESIAKLVKLGELEVIYNGGPHGANRYRVIMNPEPPREIRTPAESAPLENGDSSSQVSSSDWCEFGTPAESAPPQNSARTPAGSAPEPSLNRPAEVTTSPLPSDVRPDIERLCEHLADRIEANGSKRPKVGKAWRTACRLLLDADHRTEGQVWKAIDWCQNDEFWRANILSMPALRKQYDTLRLKAQAQQKDHARGVNGHNNITQVNFENKEYGGGWTPQSA
jgi:hypothetical protein